jgi:hypothetical protein
MCGGKHVVLSGGWPVFEHIDVMPTDVFSAMDRLVDHVDKISILCEQVGKHSGVSFKKSYLKSFNQFQDTSRVNACAFDIWPGTFARLGASDVCACALSIGPKVMYSDIAMIFVMPTALSDCL